MFPRLAPTPTAWAQSTGRPLRSHAVGVGAKRLSYGRARYKRDAELCKVLVTNRINWEVSRILGVYRYCWTGTETFHRDGQPELGLGDCPLRDGLGQTRHRYLVLLAYSLWV